MRESRDLGFGYLNRGAALPNREETHVWHPYDIQRRRVRIARAVSPLLEPLVGMEAIAYRGQHRAQEPDSAGRRGYAISPGKRAYLIVGREVLIEEMGEVLSPH